MPGSTVQLHAPQTTHELFDSPGQFLLSQRPARSMRLPVPIQYDSVSSQWRTIRYTDEERGSGEGRTKSSSHPQSVDYPYHQALARQNPRPQIGCSETV